MQLDTRLPLAAIGERINPAGIMQQAAQFRQQQQAEHCSSVWQNSRPAERPI